MTRRVARLREHWAVQGSPVWRFRCWLQDALWKLGSAVVDNERRITEVVEEGDMLTFYEIKGPK